MAVLGGARPNGGALAAWTLPLGAVWNCNDFVVSLGDKEAQQRMVVETGDVAELAMLGGMKDRSHSDVDQATRPRCGKYDLAKMLEEMGDLAVPSPSTSRLSHLRLCTTR